MLRTKFPFKLFCVGISRLFKTIDSNFTFCSDFLKTFYKSILLIFVFSFFVSNFFGSNTFKILFLKFTVLTPS